MKKNNNGIIIVLMGIIILILLTLCILFATNKLTFNNEYNTNTEEKNNEPQESNQKNYNAFIGNWHNDQTQNEIIIKNITDNEITFTWFLYRLAGIDDDTTIPFENGKAIFYYQGFNDKNYDNKLTDDEKYMRKATILLTNNGVNVVIEDVTSIDNNYKILNFDGSVYITAGTYTHSNKYK